MIREVIKPNDKHFVIDIPDEYIGKEIEIIISPIENREKDSNKTITDSLFGILKGIDIKESDYKRYLEDKYL